MKIIDAHIHLDQYTNKDIQLMLENSDSIEALVSVSYNLDSCKRNLYLSRKYQKVKPAFGFHPEQSLPAENELGMLIEWVIQHQSEMIAVGEVGLPYYLRKEQKVSRWQYGQYIDLLENFMKMAKKCDKPIVLHAVYEDAPIVWLTVERLMKQLLYTNLTKKERQALLMESAFLFSCNTKNPPLERSRVHENSKSNGKQSVANI